MKTLIILLFFISLYLVPYNCLGEEEGQSSTICYNPRPTKGLSGGGQLMSNELFPTISLMLPINRTTNNLYLEFTLGGFYRSQEKIPVSVGITQRNSQTNLFAEASYISIFPLLSSYNTSYYIGLCTFVHLYFNTTKNPNFIENESPLYLNSMINFIGLNHVIEYKLYRFDFHKFISIRAKLYTGYQFKTVSEQIGEGTSKIIERDNGFKFFTPGFGLNMAVWF